MLRTKQHARGLSRARQLQPNGNVQQRIQLHEPRRLPTCLDEKSGIQGSVRNDARSRRTAACGAALAADQPAHESAKERLAWVTLCITVFIYMSGTTMLSPVLPSIVLHFGASTQVMGAIMSSFAVAMYAPNHSQIAMLSICRLTYDICSDTGLLDGHATMMLHKLYHRQRVPRLSP